MYDIEGYYPIKEDKKDIPEDSVEVEDSVTFEKAIKAGDKQLEEDSVDFA